MIQLTPFADQDTSDTRHNDTNTTTSQHDSQSSTSTSTIDKSKFARPRQTTVTTFYAKKQIPLNLKKKIDEELLTLFTLDYQPFRIVEDRGFRRFVNALNPSYTLPNRQTISKSFIPALYKQCLNKCKNEIKAVSSACLTTDCWTSVNNESFMGITIHYLNNNFEMKSMLLKCCPFPENHTSENLANALQTTVTEWELEDAIQSTIALLNPPLPVLALEEWDHIKDLIKILTPFENVTSADDAAAEKTKKYVIGLVTEAISRRGARNTSESESVDLVSETLSNRPTSEVNNLSIWSSIDKVIAKFQPLGTSSSRAIVEVQRYVEQEVLDRNLDPLRWWKEHEYAYPNLSTIVKERCCALATSVPCERLFSKAGQLLNDRRTRLHSSKFRVKFTPIPHRFVHCIMICDACTYRTYSFKESELGAPNRTSELGAKA
ncbi:hypothetical protein ILUMI_06740 [Ignelater luminosus]|uniref:HAT C-terminal dimerisation domain-containing protein n=1 Tax=Ignelater luminosus TaxID=2038154 RepID=A0A8K0GHG8_IGNLU|nr:hypothetical protein ILUMI_06740 [Ignelater luminosus]